MIIVHHLNNSRSQRVLWFLGELGLEYEIKRYMLDPVSMRAPPSLRAVYPLGKSPVITDGILTLAGSGAIIEYLVESHGGAGLAPAPFSPERTRYIYWMHYVPRVRQCCYCDGSSSGSNAENERRCTGWGALRDGTPSCLSCGNKVCDRRLGGKSRMTRERPVRICEGGEVRLLSGTRPFTAADIQMGYPIVTRSKQQLRGRA